MKAVFVALGTVLAAVSALAFFAGRGANRREAARRVRAEDAAAQLRKAWVEAHNTRA